MGHKMCLEAPFLEILVLWRTVERESKMMPTGWSEAEGKYKDGTHWKKNKNIKIRERREEKEERGEGKKGKK